MKESSTRALYAEKKRLRELLKAALLNLPGWREDAEQEIKTVCWMCFDTGKIVDIGAANQVAKGFDHGKPCPCGRDAEQEVKK